MREIRIMLVDDHAILRDGLQLLINAQEDMRVVGQAGNGQQAVQQAKKCQPDLIIMDIAMPELGGIQATEAIKQVLPAVYILALTRHSDSGYLRRLLQAGATGYVLKKTAADDLIHAIRSVASGGLYLDPALTNHLVDHFGGRGQVGKSPQFVSTKQNVLSEREETVLRHIAWGYSNKEIASTLNLSVKTVESYKASAVEKLNLQGRTDIVRYALAQGWLHEDETPQA